MSTSRSSSADSQPPISISANRNSLAYAPDMDNLESAKFLRLRDFDSWRDGNLLMYLRITHERHEVEMKEVILRDFEEIDKTISAIDDQDDQDIHIFDMIPGTTFLLYSSEIHELSQALNFAPWIPCGYEHNVLRGLGRRLYGSYYDIWFATPLVNTNVKNRNVPGSNLGALPIDLLEGATYLYEDTGLFYLSFNTKTKQTRILTCGSISCGEKLVSVCKNAEDLRVGDDPFTLVTCALSSILQDQGKDAHSFFASIRQMEDYSNSLKFEIAENEETEVKETAIQLRKSLPYLENILETADCMIQIIEDTISEHKDWRNILPIPDNGDQHFLRVEKNLQTLRSQAISFKIYQNTRIKRINVCLSTLSSLLSLRTDSAIKASTEAMMRLTEANREDSGKMNDIAMATKLDSEAMITIAKLTMFYLPSTFVATLFSMGIFNFDFDNGKNGRLVMSSQWWMYIIFAIPLTLGTFYWFRAVTRSHKQASQKAEREAKQPE